MRYAVCILSLGIALIAMLSALPAAAQRISPPSMVQPSVPSRFVQNPPATFSPNTAPPNYNLQPGGTTIYNQPATPPNYNYNPPPVVGSPPAAFQGTVAPVPGFDPYTTDPSAAGGMQYQTPPPGGYYQPPSVLFPESGPYTPGGEVAGQPAGGIHRLFKELRFEYTWLAGDGQGALNMNTLELSTTAQFPFFYQQAPLEVMPGFAVNYISTPGDGLDPHLPPRIYDAYLDTAWRPQVTNFLSVDLGFRIGVYSDFAHTTTESIRYMGRGLGILCFSPTLQLALGAVYLDRRPIDLLPAGGVIWTPNEDTRFEILFPAPKLAKRLSTIGTTEWWGYLAGEYGGGQWTVELQNPVLGSDTVDMNDIRAMLGVEWRSFSGAKGWIEAGYVFDREVSFQSNTNLTFKPRDTFMLRSGIAY